MHDFFSQRSIEQASDLAQRNDEGALRQLIEQATSFEALKVSALYRERQRVLEELRSKIIARAGEGSQAVRNFDSAIARMTQMSTRTICTNSIQYRSF